MTGTTSRPTGLTVLAILAAISGVLSLLSALGFIAGAPLIPGVLAGTDLEGSTTSLKSIAVVLGLGWLVIGAAQLAFAYGAWTLKPWGWMLGIVMESASILLTIVIGIMTGSLVATLIASLIPLIVALVIIGYLNSSQVKTAFGRA
ncbi:MAG: hypothetical protein U0838_17720 [Chloroflexota bacterium]